MATPSRVLTSEPSIRVVEDQTRILPGHSKAVVVLESTNKDFPIAIEQLSSAAVKREALEIAQEMGIPNAAISASSRVYPINAEGLVLDQVRDEKGQPLPGTHPRMRPAAYRIEVPVARGGIG